LEYGIRRCDFFAVFPQFLMRLALAPADVLMRLALAPADGFA